MTDQELKALFEDDARAVAQEARIPAPGQVWWRAAMRARADAVRAAARPLTWSQGVAAACAAGLALAFAGGAAPVLGAVTLLVETGTRLSVPFAILIAAALAVVPVALYVALSDD